MADFHTHVTVSSVLGCGYSVAGMMAGMPPSTALVGGGLCGLAGMLPDVDSDSGIPRRETMSFAAAIVPMLLVDRFRQFDMTHDQMVLTAAALYFFIRFVVSHLIGKWSVHRGMWHSLPAVLIFAGMAFLIAGPANDLTVRYFKAFAVGLGALSHLVLDEVYSVDTRGLVPKFKKSFGTAVKLWGPNAWANFSTYAKLAAVTMAIAAEPSVLSRIADQNPALAEKLQGYSDRFYSQGESTSTQGVADPRVPAQPFALPHSGGQPPAPSPWPPGQPMQPNPGGYAPPGPYPPQAPFPSQAPFSSQAPLPSQAQSPAFGPAIRRQ